MKALENIIPPITAILGDENIFTNEPMKNHTSFRVGGPALILVTPQSLDSLAALIKLLSNSGVPFYVMGNGTNLLVKDEGFNGVIIKISDKMSEYKIDGVTITALSGIYLSRLSRLAAEHSLTGLEFAEGIPGTLGGAVVMNAGAYGGEMKDVIKRVTVCDFDGNVFELSADSLELGYRTSVFGKKDLICLSATLELKKGDISLIREKMGENRGLRIEKQPIDKPSAGSTFKRPKGHFAGKLISGAGLKGYSVGGASVSEKHSGFVINDGCASASDILSLIGHIQKTVHDMYGVWLETEVRIIG